MSEFQAYLDKALKEVKLLDIEDKPNIIEYDIDLEVRELIINTRTKLGITQKQLAEKSGVSQSNISKIENGTYKPSITILKRIADAFEKRLIIEFE